jgi:hypothetical protein
VAEPVPVPLAADQHPGTHVVIAAPTETAPTAPTAPVLAAEAPVVVAREDLAPQSPGPSLITAPSPAGAAITPFMFKTQQGECTCFARMLAASKHALTGAPRA